VLEASEAVAFLPSQDLDRAEQFFAGMLDLPLVSRSSFAYVFRCGGTTLRVTRVDDLQPQPFTVFGWLVPDLRSAVIELRDRGVGFVRYQGLDQDDQGVWTTPGGDLVAWFHDPDRNVLSLTELSSQPRH
jgi:catechol 2,3-dioxygenase-like lactoylglutathione lyase family enzyme